MIVDEVDDNQNVQRRDDPISVDIHRIDRILPGRAQRGQSLAEQEQSLDLCGGQRRVAQPGNVKQRKEIDGTVSFTAFWTPSMRNESSLDASLPP